MTGHVGTSLLTGLSAESLIRQQAVQQGAKLSAGLDRISTASLYQFHSLLEVLILGAENDRNTIDSRLERIVDTNAKASANIGNLAITIDRRQQTEAVDN